MAVGFAAGRWDWTGATHLGESCFRLDALGIVADQQQHLGGGAGGDAMRLNQLRGTSGGERFEVGVVFLDLGIQLSQRRAIARSAILADTVTEVITPGRRAARRLISVILP